MADDMREYLKDVITNITKDEPEKAQEAFHSYLVQKMQQKLYPERQENENNSATDE